MQTPYAQTGDKLASNPGFEHRPPDAIETLTHRINRIEGQVRGLRGMLERDTPSREMLVQTSAIIAALRSLERVIVSQHMKDCLIPALQAGNYDAINGFLDCLSRTNQ